jgi:hypothetical protein
VYVNRVTGEQTTPVYDPRRVIDLDRTSLTRVLCTGQQQIYVSYYGGHGLPVGVPGELASSGPWAAGTTYADKLYGDPGPGRVELQHCGAKPKTLKICTAPLMCSQPVINGSIVAWTENRTSTVKPQGRLVVRSLRTGRIRATPWTSKLIDPLLVGQRLYLVPANRLLPEPMSSGAPADLFQVAL